MLVLEVRALRPDSSIDFLRAIPAAGLKDAPCPFTGTSQGAQLIKQGKLQNFCRNYLRKSDSVVPWQLGKCAILSVQQSCLEAMGVSPQCAPLLFDNYGSFQTPQYGNTTQSAYYVRSRRLQNASGAERI